MEKNKEAAKERIVKLRKLIDYYRSLYHTFDSPEISDAVFDTLKNELEELENRYPELTTSDSPTQKIGGKPLDKFEKVIHEKKMFSFNDAFSEEEMRAWLKRLENYLGRSLTNADFTQTNADKEFLYEDLTYKIRGVVFSVKKQLGLGHKEGIYQKALEEEFKKLGLIFEKEKSIDIRYDNKRIGVYRPDFIIENKIILEIKALPFVGKFEEKQLWYYLKASNYKLALLVNFGRTDIDIKRIIYDTAREFPRESALSQRKSALFYCELKIDGLAIELVYEKGLLKEGSTRGDGAIGENVTQNLKTIFDIPQKLEKLGHYDIPGHLIVRGEAFVSKKEFERINREQRKKDQKTYANPRNLAAGSIRQLDPDIIASRKLFSFQYDIALPSEALAKEGIQTHEEKHKILLSWGFKINPYNKTCKSLEEVFKFRDFWEKNREKLDYEIDGIIAIINNNEIFEKAGVIGKAPRAAIAYKFSPKEAETILKDIKVQVGRTGALTPVAILNPVEVGGITITHATLHNYDEIKRLGVKIGDTVIVSRAGDVIPKIIKVIKELRTGKEKEFKMPKVCPVDGSKVTQNGVIYRCSNPRCGARHRESLKHFVSRGAFNIEGLGPKILDRFLDEGLISDAADLFTLKKEDFIFLESLPRRKPEAFLRGFGEKSAKNIVEEISAKNIVSLERFIYSLGILHVGEKTAILLTYKFIDVNHQKETKISDILKYFKSIPLEELQQISDIGPKVSQSIYNWFCEERNIKFLQKLEKVGVRIEVFRLKAKSQKLKAKVFVLTGSLELMSREQAKEKIRLFGGDISESVSKKTDYLVAGNEPGSKYDTAEKLGVKIIGEKEFLQLLK